MNTRPKLVEVGRHPNIEVLTYTEVDRVEGEAGEFNVTLIKKPRYIEEEKCTGCGACVSTARSWSRMNIIKTCL